MSNSNTRSGSLKWFDAARGYGFITDDETTESVFVHSSKLVSSGITRLLEPGTRLEFELALNSKNGRLHAVNLKRQFPSPPPAESHATDEPIRFGDTINAVGVESS